MAIPPNVLNNQEKIDHEKVDLIETQIDILLRKTKVEADNEGRTFYCIKLNDLGLLNSLESSELCRRYHEAGWEEANISVKGLRTPEGQVVESSTCKVIFPRKQYPQWVFLLYERRKVNKHEL